MAYQNGASVSVRNKIPSIDLASLVDFLVKAFPTSGDDGPLSWPVLTFNTDTKRIGINTYGIMRRFVTHKKMLEAFKQSDTTGFMRDVEIPSKGFTAKMGGRLFDDNKADISKNIVKLKKLIIDEIERLGISPDDIVISDATTALLNLATKTGIKDFLKESSAQMVAMEFVKPDASNRIKEVARVLSATEEIQAEDWLKRMTNSIIEVQSGQDDEFDEIQRDRLIETLKQDFDKHDSQITRFMNFLEDEALSRVRLKVSFSIMEGLAAQVTSAEPSQRFANYVHRVTKLFDYFGAPESRHALNVNLSKDYTLEADFSISNELVKATFYGCLPVWSEWKTQLFEAHSADNQSSGTSIVREVSYRFRVNGKDPKNEMIPAFDARLKRLRKALIDTPVNDISSFTLRRSLSEVIFLWLSLNPLLNPADILTEAHKLTELLGSQGKNGIVILLDDLRVWSPTVKVLSSTMIGLLKTKSKNVVVVAQKSIDDLFLVVQQSVVDWSAIEKSKGKPSDPLVKPSDGGEVNVEWFKHIKITRKPDEVLESLFSIRVRTRLNERTLSTLNHAESTLQVARQPPKELLNITWRPIHVYKENGVHKRDKRSEIDPAWLMGAGIDIWYDPEHLTFKESNSKSPVEDRRQFRAATATSATILIYTVLQVLTQRLPHKNSLAALMLRFQAKGKDASENDGDHLIYAMSQAIESALMRDIPVRMQGLVTDGDRRYKDRGAAFALSAAFPIVISAKPSIDKIAVVIYVTRPCDDYPGAKEVAGFIFQAKTYLADAVSESGYRFAFDRMQTHIVETRDAFESPQLIIEEVSRLQEMGYEHQTPRSLGF